MKLPDKKRGLEIQAEWPCREGEREREREGEREGERERGVQEDSSKCNLY